MGSYSRYQFASSLVLPEGPGFTRPSEELIDRVRKFLIHECNLSYELRAWIIKSLEVATVTNPSPEWKNFDPTHLLRNITLHFPLVMVVRERHESGEQLDFFAFNGTVVCERVGFRPDFSKAYIKCSIKKEEELAKNLEQQRLKESALKKLSSDERKALGIG